MNIGPIPVTFECLIASEIKYMGDDRLSYCWRPITPALSGIAISNNGLNVIIRAKCPGGVGHYRLHGDIVSFQRALRAAHATTREKLV